MKLCAFLLASAASIAILSLSRGLELRSVRPARAQSGAGTQEKAAGSERGDPKKKAQRAAKSARRRQPVPPPPVVRIDEEGWPSVDSLCVWIRFGLKDRKPSSWSGRVSATGARVARVRPWRFGTGMKVGSDGLSWECASWEGPEPRRRAFDAHLPDRLASFVRPGVLIDLEGGGAGARLEVATPQGSFRLDLEELLAEAPTFRLEGRVAAHLALYGRPVAVGSQPKAKAAGGPLWHDYPSVAVSPLDPGDVWFSYQTYSKGRGGDQVVVRRWLSGKWQAAEPVSAGGEDIYGTALTHDSRGRLWLVYCAQVRGNWDLYGRSFAGGRWEPVARLTDSPQPDMHQRLVRDRNGSIWLVWQGFRGGQSDILARRWNGERWEPVERVSTSPANDWEPSAAAHPRGGIGVAWDTYEAGHYDVYCRWVGRGESGGRSSPVIRVTGTPDLEARASVACDRKGRLWIAYDKAGPHWGKDTGFWLELQKSPQGTRLYEGRSIGLAVVDPSSGAVSLPSGSPLDFRLDASLNEQAEYPHLVLDARGRLWMFFRRRMEIDLSKRGVGWRFHWELCASRLDPAAEKWTAPRLVTDSAGRLDMRPALAASGDRIWAAWTTDHRLAVGSRPDVASVFGGYLSLRGLPEGDAAVAASRPPPPSGPLPADPAHPNEAADVARVRGYEVTLGDKRYRIYRGDMHRHTENSPDGGGDGSLLDAYRYALDAAALDFLLVSDHNDGNREYDWWRREKSNDLFRVGDAFVGLYGYERSVPYPNGHRNVFFTQRGVRPLDILPGERRRKGKIAVNSGAVLYPYLREHGGICFSHTSATGMGTDWRDNDPELEPLVEIFQGDRTSYETLKGPWSARKDAPGTQEGGFQPLGFVDRALAKRYKLGFQSSSDHLSTHLSYSCVLAERNARGALMDAMRRRHAYAATDNIILDVRSESTDGPRMMGDAFTSRGKPRFRVKVIGTGRLERVVVIRNNEVVYSTEPSGEQAEFTYVDVSAEPGKESYYYVRALQSDRRLAWSSPLWITPEG